MLQATSIHVSAAKWTMKGNLVVTAGPDVTPEQLAAAAPLITSAVQSCIPSSSPPCQMCANVKWSQVLINRVPTGVTDTHTTHTPQVCHQALLTENPQYRPLRVSQLPSWVKKPDQYKPHSASSLVFVFEDPDRSLATSLVASCYLFLFGDVCIVKQWKQHPRLNKDTVQNMKKKHDLALAWQVRKAAKDPHTLNIVNQALCLPTPYPNPPATPSTPAGPPVATPVVSPVAGQKHPLSTPSPATPSPTVPRCSKQLQKHDIMHANIECAHEALISMTHTDLTGPGVPGPSSFPMAMD